uniref:Uncharacterized protein n=1 Tax=Romanomermis culicivorax TaxID=13658 RepID=A0A915J9I9_ROMCU
NYVHTGTQPSILRQLCVLPFAYFSDPKLSRILYPTLISCCYKNADNRLLLEQELSSQVLVDFIEEYIENHPVDETNTVNFDEFDFAVRFPRSEFENAKRYFAQENFE